jgi:hypothetical protein
MPDHVNTRHEREWPDSILHWKYDQSFGLRQADEAEPGGSSNGRIRRCIVAPIGTFGGPEGFGKNGGSSRRCGECSLRTIGMSRIVAQHPKNIAPHARHHFRSDASSLQAIVRALSLQSLTERLGCLPGLLVAQSFPFDERHLADGLRFDPSVALLLLCTQ